MTERKQMALEYTCHLYLSKPLIKCSENTVLARTLKMNSDVTGWLPNFPAHQPAWRLCTPELGNGPHGSFLPCLSETVRETIVSLTHYFPTNQHVVILNAWATYTQFGWMVLKLDWERSRWPSQVCLRHQALAFKDERELRSLNKLRGECPCPLRRQ